MSAKEAKAKKNDKSNGAKPEKPDIAKYSDGHPLDVIQYLEAKLILKPDPFTSVESFREFGRIRHSLHAGSDCCSKGCAGGEADPALLERTLRS